MLITSSRPLLVDPRDSVSITIYGRCYWSTLPVLRDPIDDRSRFRRVGEKFLVANAHLPLTRTRLKTGRRDTGPAELIRSPIAEEGFVGITPSVGPTHRRLLADCCLPKAPQSPILSTSLSLRHGWKFKSYTTTGVSLVRNYHSNWRNGKGYAYLL